MYFHKAEIKLGDTMFDVALGYGNVVKVNEVNETVQVKLGNMYVTYDKRGKGIFNAPTLFWQDPYFGFTPPKDTKNWGVLKDILATVSNKFCELRV